MTRLEDPALHLAPAAAELKAILAEDAQLAKQIDTWLAEWEAMGIVDRRRIGKHKTVQSKKLVDFAIAA